MGRMKIKKKEAVIPFRDTIAYRMILLTVSLALFIFSLYEMFVWYRASDTVKFSLSGLLSAMAGVAVYFNLDQMRVAKIPPRTLQRMKRR
jgi:hypothetical protein